MTVEEARGNVRGREYHGLVYSVTDDKVTKTESGELGSAVSAYIEPVSYTHLDVYKRQPVPCGYGRCGGRENPG